MKKRFVKDLVIYAPSQFLPALTAFITTPILTRLLAPAEYGYWAQAMSVSGFLVALAASGMGSAASRFYPAYEAQSAADVFFGTFGVSLAAVITVFGCLGLLVLALLKAVLPTWFVPLFPIVLLIFAVQSVSTVFTCVIRAQGRSSAYTMLQLLTSYGGLGLGLLLAAYFGLRVRGLMWGTFITVALALPVLLLLATNRAGIHPNRFQRLDAKKVWEYSWPLTLGNVGMWGLRVSDLFIIGAFWPARDVGLYTVSYNISSRSIELLVALFLLGVSPLVYRTWETEGREATATTLTIVTRVYLIVCFPAAVGLSVLAFPFVALLTAPEYYEGARIVHLVVFSSLVLGLANIFMLCLTVKEQARRLGAIQMIAAAIHIGLQLLLVPRFGYVAAAISTLIGYTALLLVLAFVARAHLAWPFPFTTLRNVIAASAVMGLAAWGVYGLAGAGSKGSPPYVLLSIAVAVPIYALCLWWLGEVDEAEKKTVVMLWDRATGR